MATSTNGSSSEVLLGRAMPAVIDDKEVDADRPVRLRSFRRNVRRCKIAVGGSLLAALITGVIHLSSLPVPDKIGRGGKFRDAHWLPAARWAADAIVLLLMVVCSGLLLMTLVQRPFPARLRPADLGKLANMGVHRLACMVIFISSVLAIVLHLAPGVMYTIVTKRGPPTAGSAAHIASRLHVLSLIATFFSVGCMRRGPALRAREPTLGTGFGVRSSKPDVPEEEWYKLHQDMDDDATKTKVIDYGDCSMLTFLTLGYSMSLARKSLEVDQLTQADLPMLEEWVRKSGNEYLTTLGPRGGEIEPFTSAGLVRALWSGRGAAILLTFGLETLNTVISFTQVTALHELIATFSMKTDDKSYAYLMCWAMLLGQSVEVLLSAYLWVRENYILHNPVRMTLSAILYAKILRSSDVKAMEAQHLTSEEDQAANKGRSQVMNLLTIDTNVVSSMATYLWNITNGVVRLFIGIYFLWAMLGPSAIISLIAVPIFAPMSAWVAKKIYVCDKSWARARDARTGAIKEFLMGIKVIKLNGFEDYESRRVSELRRVETGWQRWRYTLGTLFNMIAELMPMIAIVTTFIFYTKVAGHTLEPATAFVAITVFERVRSGLDMIPNAVDVVLTTKIALDRLKRYLNQDEITVNEDDVSDGMIAMDNATYTWPKAEEEESGHIFKMRRVSLSLPVGKLTLVCGPLGSGKSLFLRALLGEAKLESGHIISPRSAPDTTPLDSSLVKFAWTNELWLENSIAYSPQMTYIRHGTVRDNILFGQPFWSQRYHDVLKMCSLEQDLKLLVDGDMTEVGEHGANLSGGQKARINLARCVYSRARTIYLDDVLSAVDAHTAQYIVDHCFRGPLLRDRTVVLVSHHVDLCLPAANYVVALADGRVQEACSARRAHVATLRAMASPVQAKTELPSPPSSPRPPTAEHQSLGALHTYNELEADNASNATAEEDYDVPVRRERERENTNARVLYTEEHQAGGHVHTSHYWMVLRAAGGWGYWMMFVFIYLGGKAVGMLVPWVVRLWTDDPDQGHLDHYIGMYLAVNIIWSVMASFRWVWLYGIGRVGFYSAGTKKIHKNLFDTVCNAPLSFFESTPAGRILNIFAQDMRRLETQSADSFGRTVMAFLRVASSALVVGWEAPAMLLVLVAFGVPFFLIANGLGKLRTNLRRLSATADSPLISLYHDSIDGVVMLRAFGLPAVMTQAMKVLINRARTAETWNWICYNWVRAVVLSLSSVFVTATGVVLVGRDMSAALAGFILSFAASMSGDMFSLLEEFIQLEQTFVSAERINHYIANAAQEPTDGMQPPAAWPSEGRVQFKDLSVRYAPDLPDVLHRVSFEIEPGQRVGVVGATGSGKSTLALSLFRAIEATSGSITVDGVDIADVTLRGLRKSLNMVVQDGSLPSGSLRNALDITGERDDWEIYDALKRVHLLSQVISAEEQRTNPFANLDTFVAIEGSNFSHGQRQLLCLARALLKKSKVLVMDEATSSVDFEMDAKITATIRECFNDTTMLVIAHRLATIVGYDRVLVLEHGNVKEYDRPLTLMEREGSAFRAFCTAQGEEEFQRLLKIARAA